MKNLLFILLLMSMDISAQHGFPTGHWCNTEQGWACKRCRAIAGLKTPEQSKVITIPHRGYWGAPGKPECSLQAIIDAYNQNYMFIEADIVLTKDSVLVLMHDQQPNRQLNTPIVFDTDGSLNDNGAFVRSINYWTTSTGVPNDLGKEYDPFPKLENSKYKDRYNNVTSMDLNTFDELISWLQNKEAVITIDIKTGNLKDQTMKNEYLKTIRLCLQKGKQKGVLHQLIFKPGSSGQVTIPELQTYLTRYGMWNDFSNLTNVVLINIIGGSFPLATNKAYLDAWYALPSLVGVELIFKTNDDELLQPKAEFGNKSIVRYTQDKGFRTGVFHNIPTNKYGSAGGRGNYFNPPNLGTLSDLRGSMEFLFGTPPVGIKVPGMLVTDNPDEDMAILGLFNMNSQYTKRTNPY